MPAIIAPTDPALEAGEPVSQTAIQIMSTLEDTDATFHACMPVATLHEPGFVFVFQTGFGTIATLGQDDMLHTQVMSQLFIVSEKRPRSALAC